VIGRFVASKIRSITEMRSEKKNVEHFDRTGLSSEKEGYAISTPCLKKTVPVLFFE